MRASNRIFFFLKKQYHRVTKTPETSFIPCFESKEIDYEFLIRAQDSKQIKSIIPINNPEIVPFIYPDHQLFLVRSVGDTRKTGPKYFNRTGTWTVIMKDNSKFIIARYSESLGRNKEDISLIVCKTSQLMKLRMMAKKQREQELTPKKGVYQFTRNKYDQLEYKETENIPVSKVVHPKFEYFLNKIPNYFNNVDQYLQYKRPGLKKILMAGEPGTSKSSMFYHAALKHKSEYSILFATNIGHVVQHLRLCAKYKVPAIVFYEDCEADLWNGSSDLRNFLDGINTPRNVAGSMLIMSTNQPQRIDETISERPGRIGEIIHIGALEGQWALDCAKLYFGKYIKSPEEYKQLSSVFDGRTGDQIRFLLELSKDYSIETGKKIDAEMIKEMWKKVQNQITSIKSFAKKESKNSMFKKDAVGFKQIGESSPQTIENW